MRGQPAVIPSYSTDFEEGLIQPLFKFCDFFQDLHHGGYSDKPLLAIDDRGGHKFDFVSDCQLLRLSVGDISG